MNFKSKSFSLNYKRVNKCCEEYKRSTKSIKRALKMTSTNLKLRMLSYLMKYNPLDI